MLKGFMALAAFSTAFTVVSLVFAARQDISTFFNVMLFNIT